MTRPCLLPLGFLALCPPSQAQTPEIVVPRGFAVGELALFTNVEVLRPTIVILLPVTLADTGTQHLRIMQRAADSLTVALGDIIRQHGYSIEQRASRWAAIHDRRFNAHYAAASTLAEPGLVIVTPGFSPRLLRFWPTPAQLEDELKDYAQIFRPLLPS